MGKRGNVHVHPQSPGLLDVWKGCSYQMLPNAIGCYQILSDYIHVMGVNPKVLVKNSDCEDREKPVET